MYRIIETPEPFVQQLGIRQGSAVAARNAPQEFIAALEKGMPPGAQLVTGNDMTIFSADVILFWPEDLHDVIEVVNWRLEDPTVPITSFWVVIPKKPVAEERGCDLLVEDILDGLRSTGLVDAKTLTFSDEEYGVRLVPRR